MFMVSAACSKEEHFTSLCSALSMNYFYFFLLLFLFIPDFIIAVFLNFFILVCLPCHNHSVSAIRFLHLNVRNIIKGHLSIGKHCPCTWPGSLLTTTLGSKLPVLPLKRTDMTWLCCCTAKWGPSTLASMAILGRGWWESRVGRYFQTS